MEVRDSLIVEVTDTQNQTTEHTENRTVHNSPSSETRDRPANRTQRIASRSPTPARQMSAHGKHTDNTLLKNWMNQGNQSPKRKADATLDKEKMQKT